MAEKRLYILVPEQLEVPETGEWISQSCGRNAAQAVHVGSKLKIQESMDPDLETTTIILKAFDSEDLAKALDKIKQAGIPWATFLDTNEVVYKTKASLLTAVACLCTKKKGKKLFYGFESWNCNAN